MNEELFLGELKLSMPWQTVSPFLFCVHHLDHYPKANAQLGPDASLHGRSLGSDFSNRDGFNMYHGQTVPGFPQHPHRGFETVTATRKGWIDHADSMGIGARYGEGDVQWLTAGRGIVHAEMFPLLNREADNPVELFQIWLNLPAKNKMTEPGFKMFHTDEIPLLSFARDESAQNSAAQLKLIAGHLNQQQAPEPPQASWAHSSENEVAILEIKIESGGHITLPQASAGVIRSVYLFSGKRATIADREITLPKAFALRADEELRIAAHDSPLECLVLQGRPIEEPVAQHGPFVMNSREELAQAFKDYQRTAFGGWPWDIDGPVHGSIPERSAIQLNSSSLSPLPKA